MSLIESIKGVLSRNRMTSKLYNIFQSSQLLKFCFMGGIATIINYSFFYILLVFGVHYLISSASGYILGMFIGFVLNKKFTFESKSKKTAVEIIKYFIVYSLSLFFGLLFLEIQVRLGIDVLLANLFSVVLIVITNFTGCKFVVFDDFLFKKRLDFLLYRYKYLIRYIDIYHLV